MTATDSGSAENLDSVTQPDAAYPLLMKITNNTKAIIKGLTKVDM
ncbi:hypothetical protein [Pontibacter sp. HSC-36F09]|nr:hypothetical protein [Pontibacter sp. HSC-36F09]MCP2042387.1 hypothetical protein [Pontibacter sp. HSC-36F09]